MRISAAAVALILMLAPAAAQKNPPVPTAPAKAPAVPPKMVAMQVLLVKSADPGCEPNCAEWIAAQGDIDQSSVASFRKVLKTIGNRRVPILIDSNGGSVDASFQIGRMIRAKGLDVAVTKTVFKPCAADDKACLKLLDKQLQTGAAIAGQPREYLSKCASSCAFILAAGTRRYVGPRTFVGVHQITTFQTQARVLRKYKVWVKRVWGVPVETKKELVSEQKISETVVQLPTKDSTYTKIRKYFAEMGIDDRITTMLMETPASTLHVLTRQELVETRMATDLIDGQQLLTGVPTLKPSVAAALALPTPPAHKPNVQAAPTTAAAQPDTSVAIAVAPDGASLGPIPSLSADGATMAGTDQATGPPLPPAEASAATAAAVAVAAAAPAPAADPTPAAVTKPTRTAALTTPKPAEVKPRPSTADSARPGNQNCACPQMKTCTGSWATMTCSGLKALCRSADTLTYTKNGCGRLKELVGY